jgi:hypothetical protein
MKELLVELYNYLGHDNLNLSKAWSDKNLQYFGEVMRHSFTLVMSYIAPNLDNKTKTLYN